MKIVLLALVAAVALFVAPVFFQKNGTTSRRFTVEVDTPDGVKSGSTVVSFTSSTAPWWFPVQTRNSVAMQGEAVVVDLGSGRHLFMLTRTLNHVRRQFDRTAPDFAEFLRPVMLDGDGRIVSALPMFVSFEDIEDRTTGFEVDPTNLSASFGPGYALRHVRVQKTDEAPTLGAMDKFEAMWGGFDEIDRLAFTRVRRR